VSRQRDPLSVAYDGAARRALHMAIIAHRTGRGVKVRIVSPGPELRRLDVGGLTQHERAFQRACYYPVFKVPRREGLIPKWSLKVTWAKGWERRGSRYGRTATLRMFRYGSGYRHASRGQSYVADPDKRATVDRIGDIAG
jgi:hypothetical protein